MARPDAHAHLLDAIAARPHDKAPWSVYADLLQTEEHPRGELISLMLQRERQPSARLLELQRRLLAQHAGALAPVAIPREAVVAWRRGFASEVRIDSPALLAEMQQDASLRFVEAATLVIDRKRWKAWRKALSTARMPWRRLRIEPAKLGELEVAPFLTCAPQLEVLRIEDAPELTWKHARGEHLRLLVLVNAGDVATTIDDAELPSLEELRLLGESDATEVRTSATWRRLKRVVLGAAVEADESIDGPVVHVTAELAHRVVLEVDPDDSRYDRIEQPLTTTFFVVGEDLSAALLTKLATRLRIAHLSARVATVRGFEGPVTAVQLFGTADSDLLPYGLAIALRNVLPTTPPVALVEIDEERAGRFLVLADTAVRDTHRRADEAVRRALDIALGRDFGSAALDELLDALATTPIERLLGAGATEQLTVIDPASAPLVVAEELDDYDDDDYGDDDYDGYDDEEQQFGDVPLPHEDDAVPANPPPPNSLEEAVFDDDDNVDEAVDPTRPEDEDALVPPPEHSELWLDFREHWEDRAIAVDDEEGEIRWPDPEHITEEGDPDALVAQPACTRHRRALSDCTLCDALHCVECGGEDYCASCFAHVVHRDAVTTVATTS